MIHLHVKKPARCRMISRFFVNIFECQQFLYLKIWIIHHPTNHSGYKWILFSSIHSLSSTLKSKHRVLNLPLFITTIFKLRIEADLLTSEFFEIYWHFMFFKASEYNRGAFIHFYFISSYPQQTSCKLLMLKISVVCFILLFLNNLMAYEIGEFKEVGP